MQEPTSTTATTSFQTSALLALPAELIFHTLTYLSALDLASIAQTCHRLHLQACDDQIWQPLVSANLPSPLRTPHPLKSFRALYIAHHPHWFLPRHRLWFADSEPSGKLLLAQYDPRRGCIEAYAVTAVRGTHDITFWEKDPEVIIHTFHPRVSLDRNQPVLKLDADTPSPPSYSAETPMQTFHDPGLHGSFMLCRPLPPAAIGPRTAVWPPTRLPAYNRVRNASQNSYTSAGHRPSKLADVSEHNFRLRKWVEYTGRRSSPTLSAALGPYFAAGLHSTALGGMGIRMPEDVTMYASLPAALYTPTPEKPWQGIWCGDYSGHGCEFIAILQPDAADAGPLPEGMDWLREWFSGGRRGSASSESSFASAREELSEELQTPRNRTEAQTPPSDQQHHPPAGRLEAIKLTGDPNIPRGEHTFIAPDIGAGGLLRVADEAPFKGARVVKSAGHIAGRGFREDQWTPSQLIMVGGDCLAQFWEGFGHVSFFRRVDLGALGDGA